MSQINQTLSSLPFPLTSVHLPGPSSIDRKVSLVLIEASSRDGIPSRAESRPEGAHHGSRRAPGPPFLNRQPDSLFSILKSVQYRIRERRRSGSSPAVGEHPSDMECSCGGKGRGKGAVRGVFCAEGRTDNHRTGTEDGKRSKALGDGVLGLPDTLFVALKYQNIATAVTINHTPSNNARRPIFPHRPMEIRIQLITDVGKRGNLRMGTGSQVRRCLSGEVNECVWTCEGSRYGNGGGKR